MSNKIILSNRSIVKSEESIDCDGELISVIEIEIPDTSKDYTDVIYKIIGYGFVVFWLLLSCSALYYFLG